MEIEKIVISTLGGAFVSTIVVFVLRHLAVKYFENIEEKIELVCKQCQRRCDSIDGAIKENAAEVSTDIRELYKRTDVIPVIERDLQLLRAEHDGNHRRR